MNDTIQDRFDRLDAALNALVASITSYNPSTAAAETLIKADDDVSESLDQLVAHQRNYQTIQQLRATTEALDARIKCTLSQLAETRNVLRKSTPVTVEPRDSAPKPVEAKELLAFAQRLARYTVPPKMRGGVDNEIGLGTPQQARSKEGKAMEDLEPGIRGWLEPPINQTIYTPWPTDEALKKGALSSIEHLWLQGTEPSSAATNTES